MDYPTTNELMLDLDRARLCATRADEGDLEFAQARALITLAWLAMRFVRDYELTAFGHTDIAWSAEFDEPDPGRAITDKEALDDIQFVMDGEEWDASTASYVASRLRKTGRAVRDYGYGDE